LNIGLEVNKIYNCDYKEKICNIKDESIDMILTDIPNNINKKTNLKDIKDYNKADGNSTWEDSNKLEWNKEFDIKTYIEECCRILKPSGSIIVWSSWQQLYLVDSLIEQKLLRLKSQPRIGVWKKTNPQIDNMDKMAVQPYEFFIWNRKGPNAVFNNQNGKHIYDHGIHQKAEYNFFECSAPNNEDIEGKHPKSKPIELFEWLILTYTNEFNKENERSIIFDGCIGGGTTAIAAIKNKRNFIGFEKEKEYFEISKERLDKLKYPESIENV
jgi:site-specific DNA-methyltransferase (adenine-specific)